MCVCIERVWQHVHCAVCVTVLDPDPCRVKMGREWV